MPEDSKLKADFYFEQHFHYFNGINVENASFIFEVLVPLNCRVDKIFLMTFASVANFGSLLAAKFLDYPHFTASQAVGSDSAAIFRYSPVTFDFFVETVMEQCDFPQACTNDVNVGLNDSTLRKYAYVQTSFFVNINGKLHI